MRPSRIFSVAFIVCLFLVSANARVNAQTVPPAWAKLDAGPFSVFAPAGWKFHQLQGIDSYVGEFVGQGVRLAFDFGQQARGYLKETKQPAYAITHESVGGFAAKIVRPATPGHGITGIYFRKLSGGDAFCLWGKDLTALQQELVLKIFETIRFGGAVPPYVLPPPPPPAAQGLETGGFRTSRQVGGNPVYQRLLGVNWTSPAHLSDQTQAIPDRIWVAELKPLRILAVLALEVMDKEWPLSVVLIGFIGVGAIGLLICRKWPLAAVLFLPFLAYGSLRQGVELGDPYVGPAIRAEAGLSYVVLSWVAILSSLVLVGVGTLQGWRRRKLSVSSQ